MLVRRIGGDQDIAAHVQRKGCFPGGAQRQRMSFARRFSIRVGFGPNDPLDFVRSGNADLDRISVNRGIGSASVDPDRDRIVETDLIFVFPERGIDRNVAVLRHGERMRQGQSLSVGFIPHINRFSVCPHPYLRQTTARVGRGRYRNGCAGYGVRGVCRSGAVVRIHDHNIVRHLIGRGQGRIGVYGDPIAEGVCCPAGRPAGLHISVLLAFGKHRVRKHIGQAFTDHDRFSGSAVIAGIKRDGHALPTADGTDLIIAEGVGRKIVFVIGSGAAGASADTVTFRRSVIGRSFMRAGFNFYIISIPSCADSGVLLYSGHGLLTASRGNLQVVAEIQRTVGSVGIMTVTEGVRLVAAADGKNGAVLNGDVGARAFIAAADARAAVIGGVDQLTERGEDRACDHAGNRRIDPIAAAGALKLDCLAA